jgi:hypothetical protein
MMVGGVMEAETSFAVATETSGFDERNDCDNLSIVLKKTPSPAATDRR